MRLLQISELANHFSDEFMSARGDIQWKAIIEMRNIVVYDYGGLVKEKIWTTIKEDIPVVLEKCKGIVGGQFQCVSTIKADNPQKKSSNQPL
jgi:uncharacterized protein with HEPN domain